MVAISAFEGRQALIKGRFGLLRFGLPWAEGEHSPAHGGTTVNDRRDYIAARANQL